MKRTRTFLATGVGLLVLLAAAPGCFIFAPRSPEPPSTAKPIPYLQQNEAVNVWANLELSLNNSHAQGWADNISQDAFSYQPDSAAESQFPGLFADWGREKELNFINQLYNSGVTIQAKLTDDDFTPPPTSGSQVVWEGVIYDIKVTDPRNDSVTEYRASAIITFTQEGPFWYITDWRDQQGESSPDNPGQILPSMGVLRGNFASN